MMLESVHHIAPKKRSYTSVSSWLTWHMGKGLKDVCAQRRWKACVRGRTKQARTSVYWISQEFQAMFLSFWQGNDQYWRLHKWWSTLPGITVCKSSCLSDMSWKGTIQVEACNDNFFMSNNLLKQKLTVVGIPQQKMLEGDCSQWSSAMDVAKGCPLMCLSVTFTVSVCLLQSADDTLNSVTASC